MHGSSTKTQGKAIEKYRDKTTEKSSLTCQICTGLQYLPPRDLAGSHQSKASRWTAEPASRAPRVQCQFQGADSVAWHAGNADKMKRKRGGRKLQIFFLMSIRGRPHLRDSERGAPVVLEDIKAY